MDDSKFALFFVGLGALVLGIVLRGFALVYLWGWFIVPLGLPQVQMAHAIGILMLMAYMTHEGYTDPKTTTTTKIITSVIQPPIVLLFGYIVHLCM